MPHTSIVVSGGFDQEDSKRLHSVPYGSGLGECRASILPLRKTKPSRRTPDGTTTICKHCTKGTSTNSSKSVDSSLPFHRNINLVSDIHVEANSTLVNTCEFDLEVSSGSIKSVKNSKLNLKLVEKGLVMLEPISAWLLCTFNFNKITTVGNNYASLLRTACDNGNDTSRNIEWTTYFTDPRTRDCLLRSKKQWHK
ncbi:hypothetical protein HOLleu_43771 [Holothuria leucospilota]|uniref:Uncharacterized protein n=1 Tax=Holothuria leucospilota TaxID=206669 RepID=A0A9Q0YAD4_HOLLE|nr:hypothetical protein HOLleu_43771 [Holothuria leucospilota]